MKRTFPAHVCPPKTLIRIPGGLLFSGYSVTGCHGAPPSGLLPLMTRASRNSPRKAKTLQAAASFARPERARYPADEPCCFTIERIDLVGDSVGLFQWAVEAADYCRAARPGHCTDD